MDKKAIKKTGILKELEQYKQSICKFCWGKGYSSRFYGIDGAADFGYGEAWSEPKRVHISYCHCERGKQLKELVEGQQLNAKLDLLKAIYRNVKLKKRDLFNKGFLLLLRGYWKALQQ